MSSSVEDEIVRMRIDSSTFERGVATVLGLLGKLKASLNFTGADKGLDTIENKASGLKLDGLSGAVDGISKKFLLLSTVALTALSNITNRAINAGTAFVKSFTFGPIIQGLNEYKLNLQSIQTIQANTDQPLSKVNASLQELNAYSDQTIYNFAEMAKNIGTFTAAGVDLKTATSSIKGIANIAALSGSSSEQAAGAMYQLSQAISAGRVGLQDWNSVVNAGIGGKKLQTALATTAVAMGSLQKDAVSTTGAMKTLTINGKSFRESITAKPGEKPWLSSEVLVNTLATLDGRFSLTALLQQKTAEGLQKYTKAQALAKIATARTALEQKNGVKYTDAQFASLRRLSDSSFLAATQVKTLSQVFDVAKETIGSGWSASFQNIFGTFSEARTTFTELSNTINGLINANALARNKILNDWKVLGGRAAAIDAIKNIFKALGKIVLAVKDSFRDIFPRKTGAELAQATKNFSAFTKTLIPSKDTVDKLKLVFKGLFAILDIGKQILSGVFGVFKTLFGAVTQGSGGFLTFAANVGQLIYNFDQALKKGGLIQNFFKILGNILSVPIQLFKTFAAVIGGLFSSFNIGDADGVMSSVTNTGKAMETAVNITEKLSNFFAGLPAKIKPGVQAVSQAFHNIAEGIANGFNSQTFGNILKTLQTGLIAGIFLTLRRFLQGGLGGIHIDPSAGVFGQIKETLEGVTDTMKSMQQQLKAKALLEIAAAIGIIAASTVALSLIEPKKLATALKAMAVGFGQLLGTFVLMSKVAGVAGAIKLPVMAAALNLIATSLLILAAAVAIFASMSLESLKKGLSSIAILLVTLSGAAFLLSKNSVSLITASAAISALAVALNLLAIAVKVFGTLSWKEMLKGLTGVAGVLVVIAGAMKIMPKGMLIKSAAILALSLALQTLYLAVKGFARLSYKEMLRGLTGVAGALVAIAGAMQLMPTGMLLQAGALILVSIALQKIATAVAAMAKMSWKEIGRGLAVLGSSLGILALGLLAMSGSLGAAVSLLIVSKALAIFVPLLQALGKMKWSSILRGLTALAAGFAVIGVSAQLLLPVIPAMLALGVALGLVGVAMLAFGAGAALLGIGLGAIAASGGAAIAILLNGLKTFVQLLPVLATSLATGLVNFLTIIGKNAPAIITAFINILAQFLNAVPKIVPPLVVAVNALIGAILNVLVTNGPKVVAAGFALLLDLLKGIRDNISQVVATVAAIVINFLNALSQQLPAIIDAGVNLLFKLLEGIAKAAGKVPNEALKIVIIFIKSLFANFGPVVSAGASMVGKVISGISSAAGQLGAKAKSLMATFVDKLKDSGLDLLTFGANIITTIINGIAFTISNLGAKAKSLGKSIVTGIINGLGGLVSALINKIKGSFSSALDDVKDFLGIGGPSKLFADEIGVSIPMGIAQGVDHKSSLVSDSVTNIHKDTVNQLKKTMSGINQAITDSDLNFQPTIAPVLDMTQFNKDASKMGNIITNSSIDAKLSYQQANIIAASQNNVAVSTNDQPSIISPTVKIEQYNTSPKALSTPDIYRQTGNALSVAARALNLDPYVNNNN